MSFAELATPDLPPWSERAHAEAADDPRGSFQRDRDRILHSVSFRKLQHKTQVFVVHEGDFFRTRLTHTLEVAQIGRTIAGMLGLNEPLIEAICLGHDLGHAPFGHAGEESLGRLLRDCGLDWNSNAYSLTLVEDVERQYAGHAGLNLTWATREGLARHITRFDEPASDSAYWQYPQSSLEAQVSCAADIIAYSAHDLEDALAAGLLTISDLSGQGIAVWEECWNRAKEEFTIAHPESPPPGLDRFSLLVRRARRHLIDVLIRDLVRATSDQIARHCVRTSEQARFLDHPLSGFSGHIEEQVGTLVDYMKASVYKSPLVARQNYRAGHILSSLFRALTEGEAGSYPLLPVWVQERIAGGGRWEMEVARFLAGLTDRGAADLYAELFDPQRRAMGHRI